MMAASLPHDQLEADITAAAVRALRRRAEAIRKRASVGVSVLDGYRRPTILVTSESARFPAYCEVVGHESHPTSKQRAPSRRET
jgi:hypothetical protein